MKKIECPNCRGSGQVPTVPIYTMTNLDLAKKIHETLWKGEKDPQELLAVALELKDRLQRGVATAESKVG